MSRAQHSKRDRGRQPMWASPPSWSRSTGSAPTSAPIHNRGLHAEACDGRPVRCRSLPAGDAVQRLQAVCTAVGPLRGHLLMPRVYERKFDWDGAAFAVGGVTLDAIAERFDVSSTAVWFACNDEARKRFRGPCDEWSRAVVRNAAGRARKAPLNRRGRLLCVTCAVGSTAARATAMTSRGQVTNLAA